MSQALAERTRGEVARPLKLLVPLIKSALNAGDEAGVPHFRKAGEMLHEAKEQVARGEWQGWVERNFNRSVRQAQNYMRLAAQTADQKRSALRFSTLSEFTQPNRDPGHATSWQVPVREIASRVNVAALTAERQNKEKEERLMRQLSHQLIDIGYRVLSAKLHPDKGGSTEAMSRLNNVRKILKEAL